LAIETQETREPAARGTQLVQSLSRGLGILSQFTAESRSLSLADLSRRTGIHRATVYRFVRTLEVEGFLTFDADSGLYSVGPSWATALYSLGGDTVLAEILNADLRALRDAVLETVTLATRRGDQVHIISATHPDRVFRPRLPESGLVPLNASWNVHAKVHLAYASKDTQRRLLAIAAPRCTEHTLTDRESIAAGLRKVAADGVAYDHEEHRLGVCAMAVPIFVKGDVVLALGVVIPVERFSEADRERLGSELRLASERMGSRLEKASHAWRSVDLDSREQ
jgi:IclR family transcriptional regulator, acetate operon repressor